MNNAYGLWSLVILNSLIFIIFAFSFFKPQTKRDWRSFSAFSAFVVALFVEMYGFPLTIYLFSGWLTSKYPSVDFLSHENGHLLHTIFGFSGNPHFDPLHIASFIFIGLGFLLLSSAWNVLYKAQREGKLAVTGLYARVRHPQYIGFVSIMFGFLLQWPTIITVIMFPILVVMYLRLALNEEQDCRERFGKAWDDYAATVPAFIPRFSSSQVSHEGAKS
ncbi:MAG TPA: isoprenylcysteine carboxylmethyltransferase family protein [Thermodesulfobacteriota bacterium]|nr:isoprenylcysteine carboxylmethyltransferase family protein [Thermodesulfobacteriota bacterium]